MSLLLFIALWFLYSTAAAAGDGGAGDASSTDGYNPCLNCTVCEYPCYPQPQMAPPPPPPPPPQPGFGGPGGGGGVGFGPDNCPPPPNLGSGSGSGQCCENTPPGMNSPPGANYPTGGNSGTNSPPGVNYTPVPYDNYSGAQPRSSTAIWSSFAAAVVLLLQRLFPIV